MLKRLQGRSVESFDAKLFLEEKNPGLETYLTRRISDAVKPATVKVETQEFASRVRSPEAREAITAFLEKRRPNFTRAAR